MDPTGGVTIKASVDLGIATVESRAPTPAYRIQENFFQTDSIDHQPPCS